MYSFVRSNPVNLIDPDGMDDEEPNWLMRLIKRATDPRPEVQEEEEASREEESSQSIGQSHDEMAKVFLKDTVKEHAEGLEEAISYIDFLGIGKMTIGAYQGDPLKMAEGANQMLFVGSIASRATFSSFQAFKRFFGSPGIGKQWHHLVEQCQKFSREKIHSLRNLVAIPKQIHQNISAYYSSKQYFTEGLTVRQWLSTKSFEEQLKFGLEVLEKALNGTLK